MKTQQALSGKDETDRRIIEHINKEDLSNLFATWCHDYVECVDVMMAVN